MQATVSASARRRERSLHAACGAGQNDLECDISAEAQLLCVIDDPHSAPAKLTQDLKPSDLRWIDGSSIPRPCCQEPCTRTGRPAPRSWTERVGAETHPRDRPRPRILSSIRDAPGALQIGQGPETGSASKDPADWISHRCPRGQEKCNKRSNSLSPSLSRSYLINHSPNARRVSQRQSRLAARVDG